MKIRFEGDVESLREGILLLSLRKLINKDR